MSPLFELLSSIILMLVSSASGAFFMWLYYNIKKEKQISQFIKSHLKPKDKLIFKGCIDDLQFTHPYALCFIKDRLSKKNFEKFIDMAKIKDEIKDVTSTQGLYEINGEIIKVSEIQEQRVKI